MRELENSFDSLCQLLILAAAWWYERIVSPISADAFDWFYVPIRKWYGHAPAWSVATFFEQTFFPALLGGWLVWPIAQNYLQSKWQAENEAANRRFFEEQRQKVGAK